VTKSRPFDGDLAGPGLGPHTRAIAFLRLPGRVRAAKVITLRNVLPELPVRSAATDARVPSELSSSHYQALLLFLVFRRRDVKERSAAELSCG